MSYTAYIWMHLIEQSVISVQNLQAVYTFSADHCEASMQSVGKTSKPVLKAWGSGGILSLQLHIFCMFHILLVFSFLLCQRIIIRGRFYGNNYFGIIEY